MAKQPAVLVIVRHGARLDQVDRHWHETAARTYDPPLTYGGWHQCQSLGARIAVELGSLDTEDGEQRSAKRRKVIIHSSPYLRCVQTSIAVSAGLKRAPITRSQTKPTQRSTLSKRPGLPTINSASNLAELTNGAAPVSVTGTKIENSSDVPDNRPTLRLDPFLGEWLSPSYFEDSEHPPTSSELLVNAVDGLKTRAEEIRGADLTPPTPEVLGAVDWGDNNNGLVSKSSSEKTGLRALAEAGHASIPNRPRENSFGKIMASQPRPRSGTVTAYTPPIPTYAIAPFEPIPRGFVAHARDVCIKPDFEWNSMDAPLLWGDGGQYGEEWSSMHRRFRNGLQNMLEFYEAPRFTTETADEQLVLILVTHQAGCNALLRLITGAPTLYDVGTASLTMAVRNEPTLGDTPLSPQQSPTSHRRGSVDLGLSDTFSMRILASTEHLRQGQNIPGLNAPRLAAQSDSPQTTRIPLSGTRVGRSSSLRSYHTYTPSLLDPVDDPHKAFSASPTGLWGSGGHEPQIPGRAASISTPSTSIRIPSEDLVPRLVNGNGQEDRSLRTSTNDQAVKMNMSSYVFADEKTRQHERDPECQEDINMSNATSTLMPSRTTDGNGLWGSANISNVHGNGSYAGSISRARSPGKRRFTDVDR